MLEKDITSKIMRYLKTLPYCFAWKEFGGMYSTSGLPDIICCINGMFVAFEVKTDKGKLSKLQEIMIQRINAANGKAFNVTSVGEVKKILNGLGVLDNLGVTDNLDV